MTLEYKKGFSGHNINAMAGGEYFDYQYQNLEARVSGAPTDDIPTLNAGTNRTYTTSSKPDIAFFPVSPVLTMIIIIVIWCPW